MKVVCTQVLCTKTKETVFCTPLPKTVSQVFSTNKCKYLYAVGTELMWTDIVFTSNALI